MTVVLALFGAPVAAQTPPEIPVATWTQQAEAPQDGSCERYGCEYSNTRCHYTRDGQQGCTTLTGVADHYLPNGDDGRQFLRVLWPAGYDPARRAMWDRVAQCESGGNWYINTGNGYYGGVQFSKRSWDYVGGPEFAQYPHHAWPEQQIAVAERLLQTAPYARHWPHCGPRAGLTR